MEKNFDELTRHSDCLDDAFRGGIFHRSDITPELTDDLMSASYEICEGMAPRSHRDAGKYWQGSEYDELKRLWEAAVDYTHNVPVNIDTSTITHIGDRSNDIRKWLHQKMTNRYLVTSSLTDIKSVHFRDAQDADQFAVECVGLRPWDRYRFAAPQPSDLFALPDFFNPAGMEHRFHALIFPILMNCYLRSRQHEPAAYPAARPNGHRTEAVRQGTRLWHNDLARQTLDKLFLVPTIAKARDELVEVLPDMLSDAGCYYVPVSHECGFDRHRLPVFFSKMSDAILFRLAI